MQSRANKDPRNSVWCMIGNPDSSLNQDYLDSAGLSLKGRDCMSVRCGPVAVPVCACERERKLPVCRGKV